MKYFRLNQEPTMFKPRLRLTQTALIRIPPTNKLKKEIYRQALNGITTIVLGKEYHYGQPHISYILKKMSEQIAPLVLSTGELSVMVEEYRTSLWSVRQHRDRFLTKLDEVFPD